MKLFFRLVLLLLVAVPILLAGALVLALQGMPLVDRPADISPDDIARAKRLLSEHDPRKAREGVLRTFVLSQHDVDLLLNYAASELRRGSARVVLQPGFAIVQASLRVPANPFGEWVNIDAALRETGGLPAFDHLSIGRLPVPGFIADDLLARVLARLGDGDQGRLARDVVRHVDLAAEQLRVVYEWRDDIPERLRKALLPLADEERLKVHAEHLAAVLEKTPAARPVALAQLMGPMFRLARERSAQGDAQKENRAAIVTLTFYANGRGLAAIVPAAREWRKPARRRVLLNGREDFPKHFLVSAAIAAEAGSPLADAIGLYKEVADSRGGSGFSFNDIAADRAGTRFGELAVKAPRRLQDALAGGADESAFMPAVADLPEFMPETEFKRRFGGVGAPAYERMMADIERRIARLPLYAGR